LADQPKKVATRTGGILHIARATQGNSLTL
jgi:hypothetical protein